MSGRDRERDRRAAQAAQARTNEYFVPKDGIDREVITADICRYLGNDALVRPGNYQNAAGQVQNGYFITAYRNLTTAMIADLKADSERWEQERRASASGGRVPNGISSRDSNGSVRNSNTPIVGYRDSTTHQSRQYYGPTEAAPGATPGYPPATGAGFSQGVYENAGPQYSQQQQAYAPQPAGYAQQPQGGYAAVSDNYYIAGANLNAEDQARRSAPASQTNVNVPRNVYANTTPTYSQQQPDSRGQYYSPQPGPAAAQAPAYITPVDPYYGRVAGAYDSQDQYGERSYQEAGSYPQTTMAASASVPAPANSSSRRQERDRDPDRHRDHRSRR